MYKWDIKYLLALKKHLLELINETSNCELIGDYKEQLKSINYILDYYNNYLNTGINLRRKRSKVPSFKSVIYNDKELFREYRAYNGIICLFKETLEKLEFNGKLNDTRIIRKPSFILTMSKDFYSQFNGEIRNASKVIMSELNQTLNFQKMNPNCRLFGQTLPIYNSNIVFFDIRYNNTIQDFLTVIHELGHGITHILNRNILEDSKKYCISEVETLFWELVALDYLDKKTNWHSQIYNAKVMSLKSYLYNVKLLWLKMDLYNNLSLGELLNNKVFMKYVKAKGKSCNDINVEYVKSELASEFYAHTVSFAIAVELYLLYIEDKKLALNKLLKIIKAHSLSSEEYLDLIKKLGIKPCENLQLYVDKLIEEEREKGYAKTLYYRN